MTEMGLHRKLNMESARAILATLGISLRDLSLSPNSINSFSIDNDRDREILRCLFVRSNEKVRHSEIEVGDRYSILLHRDAPAAILYKDSMVSLSQTEMPDDLPAQYHLAAKISSLSHYKVAEGLVLFPGVYTPSDVLLECAEIEGCSRLLDLGCGAGLLSIKAAQNGTCCVATDINPLAVANLEHNARVARVSRNIRAIEGNLFEGVDRRDFDTIISFPPIPDKSGYLDLWERAERDPSGTLVPDMVRTASEYLQPGGTLQLLLAAPDDIIQRPERFGFEAAHIGKAIPLLSVETIEQMHLWYVKYTKAD